MGRQRREMTAVLGGENTTLLKSPPRTASASAAAAAAAAADVPEDPFSRAFETGGGRGGSSVTVERAGDGTGGKPDALLQCTLQYVSGALVHQESTTINTRRCSVYICSSACCAPISVLLIIPGINSILSNTHRCLVRHTWYSRTWQILVACRSNSHQDRYRPYLTGGYASTSGRETARTRRGMRSGVPLAVVPSLCARGARRG